MILWPIKDKKCVRAYMILYSKNTKKLAKKTSKIMKKMQENAYKLHAKC